MTPEDILYIKDLVIEAGNIAEEYQRTNFSVETKRDKSPVTHADKVISSTIMAALLKLKPNIQVVSEEEEIPELYSDTFWLVDPIDGTKSYIRREETYTVNIGLIENGSPSYGFIYQPAQKLLHYTDSERKLVVERAGQRFALQEEVRGPGRDKGWKAAITTRDGRVNMAELLKLHDIKDIIAIPSSLKLCLVADGTVDIYPRFGETMEWDIAAGHALIKAAGGEVLDMNHKVIQYSKPGFLNSGFMACGANFVSNSNLS
ncbi:MAG: inositol monophosphatase family protein [Pseudomonadota bacterium]